MELEEIRRLGPDAQAQIIKKLGKKPSKPNKLKNRKCTMQFRGEKMQFDSIREGKRWLALRAMEEAGQILDLRTQVEYLLIPPQRRADGKAERACKYIADFVYTQGGKTVVEDSKGYRNPSSAEYAKFVIKRKLMLWKHGITVMEV